jgi:acetyl esterase/lipase
MRKIKSTVPLPAPLSLLRSATLRQVLQLLLLAGVLVHPGRAQDQTLALWPQGAPGAISKPGYEEKQSHWNGDASWVLVTRVSQPMLEVFLPPPDQRNGLTVVICPGGGYTAVNMSKEGRDVARWLNTLGVVACVLKYRLPSAAIMEDRTLGPLIDGLEAVRSARRHAPEWQVRADRIGIMGFSAGGHLAATVSTLYPGDFYKASDDTPPRPDFAILVYPLISMLPKATPLSLRHDLLGEHPDPERSRLLSPELHATAGTPPTFIAHSKHDPVVPSAQSVDYARALEAAGVPVELHLYEEGEHGYALGALPNWPRGWPQDLAHWLDRFRK